MVKAQKLEVGEVREHNGVLYQVSPHHRWKMVGRSGGAPAKKKKPLFPAPPGEAELTSQQEKWETLTQIRLKKDTRSIAAREKEIQAAEMAGWSNPEKSRPWWLWANPPPATTSVAAVPKVTKKKASPPASPPKKKAAPPKPQAKQPARRPPPPPPPVELEDDDEDEEDEEEEEEIPVPIPAPVRTQYVARPGYPAEDPSSLALDSIRYTNQGAFQVQKDNQSRKVWVPIGQQLLPAPVKKTPAPRPVATDSNDREAEALQAIWVSNPFVDPEEANAPFIKIALTGLSVDQKKRLLNSIKLVGGEKLSHGQFTGYLYGRPLLMVDEMPWDDLPESVKKQLRQRGSKLAKSLAIQDHNGHDTFAAFAIWNHEPTPQENRKFLDAFDAILRNPDLPPSLKRVKWSELRHQFPGLLSWHSFAYNDQAHQKQIDLYSARNTNQDPLFWFVYQ